MVEDIKIHCCGVEEKGHCFAVEYRDEVIFLDAGFSAGKSYEDFWNLKIDLPYSDVAKIVGAPVLDNVNLQNVKGFCLSHEHSDHVSGLPFLFTEVCLHTWNQPHVFSTKATIRGVQHKFNQHKIPYDDDVFVSVEDKETIPEQHRVKSSSAKFKPLFKVKIGKHFKVYWIPVEHSTHNGYALAVRLPKKRVVIFSGDFKLNLKENRPPLNILKAFREEHKQLLLICETIGVDQEGITGTEDLMEEKLDQSFFGLNPRLILVAIRSSEVPRIHTFESLAIKLNRQIALVGDTMRDTYNAMRISYPGILVGDYVMFTPSKLKEIKEEDYRKYIFLADARMWHSYKTTFHNILKGGAPLEADATHKKECKDECLLKLGKEDMIIFSTTGPYETYMKQCQGHMKRHIRASEALFYPDLHISGHGKIGDYRIFIDVLNPEVLIPFHREKKVRNYLSEKVHFKGEFVNPKDGDSYLWKCES
jgi:ribonuclease J